MFDETYCCWNPENRFQMRGRISFLKKLSKPTLSVELEIKDIEERLEKLKEEEENKQMHKEERDIVRKQQEEERMKEEARIKEKTEKNREETRKAIYEAFKANTSKDAIITDEFKQYLNSYLKDEKKINVTISIKLFKRTISIINDKFSDRKLKSFNDSYCVKSLKGIKTDDSRINFLYDKMVDINNLECIIYNNFFTKLLKCLNETLEKLESINNDMAAVSKQKKNDWANTEVVCEFCNRIYKQSHKKRHLDTEVCKKSRV